MTSSFKHSQRIGDTGAHILSVPNEKGPYKVRPSSRCATKPVDTASGGIRTVTSKPVNSAPDKSSLNRANKRYFRSR